MTSSGQRDLWGKLRWEGSLGNYDQKCLYKDSKEKKGEEILPSFLAYFEQPRTSRENAFLLRTKRYFSGWVSEVTWWEVKRDNICSSASRLRVCLTEMWGRQSQVSCALENKRWNTGCRKFGGWITKTLSRGCATFCLKVPKFFKLQLNPEVPDGGHSFLVEAFPLFNTGRKLKSDNGRLKKVAPGI